MSHGQPVRAVADRHVARRELIDRGYQEQDDASSGTTSDDGGSQTVTGAPSVTIGEALQAAALTAAGDRPVDHADAAAVRVAEARAAGLFRWAVVPGGVGDAAQRAADANAAAGEEKARVTTLRDVVGNACSAMPANKVATWEDAMAVAAASGSSAGMGGMGEVADAVAAAAEMNDGRKL